MPCTFVRLMGCNLRCSYCDTTFSYDEGIELSEADLMSKVRSSGIGLVEITGGEPLIQTEIYPFINSLIDSGFKVLIETNGSVSIRDVDKRATLIMDLKTPASGMGDKMDYANIDLIKQSDEIKFVITDRNDYDWSIEIIRRFSLAARCHLLMSPAFGFIEPEKLARWMLDDRVEARLNLQLHKIIFGPEKRRV